MRDTAETPLSRVLAFAIDQAATVSMAQRASIYRDLAVICGDENAARKLLELAAECERLDRDCRQLRLLF